MDNSEVNFSGAIQPTSPLENAANSLPKEERKTISSKKRSKLPLIIILIVILLAATAFAVYYFFLSPKANLAQQYPGFEEIYNNSDSFEDAISISQSYIDAEQSSSQKARMYIERSKFLFENFGPQDQYTDQILSDIIRQDEILQTADSAYLAYDRYSFYNISDLALKYEDLYYERSGGER